MISRCCSPGDTVEAVVGNLSPQFEAHCTAESCYSPVSAPGKALIPPGQPGHGKQEHVRRMVSDANAGLYAAHDRGELTLPNREGGTPDERAATHAKRQANYARLRQESDRAAQGRPLSEVRTKHIDPDY